MGVMEEWGTSGDSLQKAFSEKTPAGKKKESVQLGERGQEGQTGLIFFPFWGLKNEVESKK